MTEVFEQGGFQAEWATEDAFMKAVKENPSRMHDFMAVRQRLVKLKIDNPQMRFRLEANGCTLEKVKTSLVSESGLEAPDEYWVELSAYEKKYGAANPADIVYEEVDGTSKAGVAGSVFPFPLFVFLFFSYPHVRSMCVLVWMVGISASTGR